jgi:hypothetical protein
MKRPDYPRLLLSVVGLTAGPATIVIRYQQPGSDTWLRSVLHARFTEQQQSMAPLTLGGPVPKGAAQLDHIPSKLAHEGLAAPARCEPKDEYRELFVCFSPERFSNLQRFPSCRFTPRCDATRPPHGGFFARIHHQESVVTSLDFRAFVPEQGELSDTWTNVAEVHP